jgi:hypothetical protein
LWFNKKKHITFRPLTFSVVSVNFKHVLSDNQQFDQQN